MYSIQCCCIPYLVYLQMGDVAEFMSVVMGVHSHYQKLITDLCASHKRFHSALDRVSVRVCE